MFPMVRRVLSMDNLRAAFFMMLCVGMVRAAGHLDFEEGPGQPGTSWVIYVDHQPTGGQPYSRAMNSTKQMSTSMVRGSYAIACGLTIDTSSGILLTAFDASTACPAADKPVASDAGKCDVPDISASRHTHFIRAAVNGASGRGCQGGAATTSSPTASVLVPLDNKTYGLSSMPDSVNQVYWNHYTDAHAAAASSTLAQLATQFSIWSQECSHSGEVCGHGSNVLTSSQIIRRAPPALKTVSTAASLLPLMYPANIKNTTEGGATANGPALLPDNLTCGRHTLQTTHVAACSYVQTSGQSMEAACPCNAGSLSASGIPQQVYKAGLVSNQLSGLCQLQPQKIANCGATLMPNSTIRSGPSEPCAVKPSDGLSSLSSASVAPSTGSTCPQNLADSSASLKTNTFGSAMTVASLPGYQGDTATTVSSASSPASVLIVTGGDDQSTMPDNVYQAYMSCTEYYTSACTAAISSAMTELYFINVQGCVPSLSWPQSCQFITPATSTARIASVAGLWLAGLWLFGGFVQFDPGGQAVGQPCIDCIH